jgi:hypothetical protein
MQGRNVPEQRGTAHGIHVAWAWVKGDIMADRRTIQACHWSEPTLFLAWPQWMDAEVYPWSCHADGDPQLVEDTERCAKCGRWAGRQPSADTRRSTND